MPEELELQGNKYFVSKNNVVYYGVRNELGYFLDDIFLYTLEHRYYPNNENFCKTYARSTTSRLLFHNMVKDLNSSKWSAERPDYLQLTEEEQKSGDATRRDNGSVPFYKFRLKINIPTLAEFNRENSPFRDFSGANLVFETALFRPNKVVIVGYDSNVPNQNSFYDAAETWERGKKYMRPINTNGVSRGSQRQKQSFNSAQSAIQAIQNAKRQNKPVTEIYFSTHGATYAVDFGNPRNGLYTSREQVRRIIGENDWIIGTNGRDINIFEYLVRNNYLAENATLTFGGCMTGAQRRDVESTITYYMNEKARIENISGNRSNADNDTLEAANIQIPRLRNFLELNAGVEKIQNFAYLLSKKLPKATILTTTSRSNSALGLELPIMYQNGLMWHIFFPNSLTVGTMLPENNIRNTNERRRGIDGYYKSTLHPMLQL